MGVRAVRAHDAADEERRGQVHGVHGGRDHGRGRGLAMRAGHGHGVEAHAQARQHLRAVPDGQAPFACGDELGVVVKHGRGDDDDVGPVFNARAGDVFGLVLADAHLPAGVGQLRGVAALLHVRASHLHALVVCHARDAAHAHAADADEVH